MIQNQSLESTIAHHVIMIFTGLWMIGMNNCMSYLELLLAGNTTQSEVEVHQPQLQEPNAH